MNRTKSNNKMLYKFVSLISGVIGILALVYVFIIFAGNNPDTAIVIPVGIVAVIALPLAYITNRLGR